MEQLIHRFCIKYRVNKAECSVIHQCALFIGYLKRNGISSTMTKGFCTCAGAACRHFWVDADTQKIDIAREISKFHTPELEYIPTVLQYEIADDVKRIDLQDPKIVEENERLFELWNENQAEFWKTSSPKIRNIRI